MHTAKENPSSEKKCPYDIHDKGVEVCQYIVKTYLKDKRNTYKLNLSQ